MLNMTIRSVLPRGSLGVRPERLDLISEEDSGIVAQWGHLSTSAKNRRYVLVDAIDQDCLAVDRPLGEAGTVSAEGCRPDVELIGGPIAVSVTAQRPVRARKTLDA
jgi:hypothetical protein